MIKLGGPTKMLDNGKFENISLILINTINNLSNIIKITSKKTGIFIGILIKNPNAIILPIIRLTIMLEKIKVREIV